MSYLTPAPKQQFFSNEGVPLNGGKLYTYQAGTNTPIPTYTTAAGNIANTNPIILDSRGECNVWLDFGNRYKFKLTDANDVEIWTVDNIGGPIDSQTVNVKLYGAIGNGVADDAPAFRAAMAALGALGGGILYVPAGTYLLASRSGTFVNGIEIIVEAVPNVTVQGEGYQSVLKAANGLLNSAPTLWFARNITTNFEKFIFRDLVFDFNGANNLYPASGYYPSTALQLQTSGIGAIYIDYVMVDGCIFLDNPGRNSISVVDANTSVTNEEYARKIIITNNHFHNFGYTVANGANSNNNDHSALYIQAREVIITNNTFSNDYFDINTSNVAAAFDHHAEYCIFNNNVMLNNTYCIAHQNSGVGIKYTNISDNVARCAMFYKLFDGAGGIKGEMIFANNNIGWIAAPGYDAAVWDFYNAETSDPAATPSFDVSIIGNTVVNDGGNFAGLSASIIDIKRSDNLVIRGNQFNNSPGRCVRIRPSGRINYVKIEDNEFHYYGIGNVAGTKVGVDLDYTNVNIPANTATVVVRNNVFRRGVSPTAIEAGVKFNGSFANLTIMGNLYSNVGTENLTSSLNATTYQIEGNSQVAFLAAANLSTDPNVLDDYEEGTWTPTISSVGDATITNYATGHARYTKIGNTVVINVSFEASGLGATPQFDFSLPFAPNTIYDNISAFGFGYPYAVRWNCAAIAGNLIRAYAFSTAVGTHNVAICFSYQTN